MQEPEEKLSVELLTLPLCLNFSCTFFSLYSNNKIITELQYYTIASVNIVTVLSAFVQTYA